MPRTSRRKKTVMFMHYRKPSKKSLARAKYNVAKNYVLVGVTEEMEKFIETLERLLPKFFSGSHIFRAHTKHAWVPISSCVFHLSLICIHENLLLDLFRNKGSSKCRLPLQQRTVELLKGRLKEEYEFYNFVKQLFYKKAEKAAEVKAKIDTANNKKSL